MRGYMRRRSKGSWQVFLELGVDPVTGKRLRRSQTLHATTRREAERQRASLLHALATGTYIEPSRLTVGDFLQRWLSDHVRHAVAPQTFERYEAICRCHLIPALGPVPLLRLRPGHIVAAHAAFRDQGLAPRTVLHHHRVLHDALQQALRWQLLPTNPASAVTPPRAERKEMRALDAEQAARLLEHVAGSEFEAQIVTALYTGLRLGELLGLRWQDVNLGQGRLSVRQAAQRATGLGLVFRPPKTNRAVRPITLPSIVVERLRLLRLQQLEQHLRAGEAWQESDLVFTDALGRPTSEVRLRKAFYRLLEEAHLPRIRLHDLRHTMATLMLTQGEHPKVVSERLGHATVNITLDTYSHVLPGLEKDAAERLAATLKAARSTPDPTPR